MRRQHSLLRRSELRVELRQFQLCPRYQKPLGLQLRDKCVAGRLEPRPRVAPLAGQQHGRGQRVQDQQHQAGPADFASADSLPSNGCGTMQFQRRNCLQVRHTFERMCHTRVNVSVHQKRPSVHKKGHLFTTLFTRCGRSHFLSHHGRAPLPVWNLATRARLSPSVILNLVCLAGAGHPRSSRPARSRRTQVAPSLPAGGGARSGGPTR